MDVYKVNTFADADLTNKLREITKALNHPPVYIIRSDIFRLSRYNFVNISVGLL